MSFAKNRFQPAAESLEQREVMSANGVAPLMHLTTPATQHSLVKSPITINYDIVPTAKHPTTSTAKQPVMAERPSSWEVGNDEPGQINVGMNGGSALGNTTNPWFGVNLVHKTWVGESISLDNKTTNAIIADLKSGASDAAIAGVLSQAFPGQDVSSLVSAVKHVGWIPLAVANLGTHGVTIEMSSIGLFTVISQ
jgi:hypothetical protein